ncbi:MAG: alanine dehydrogenase [Verrucomicrobia bacterium 21-51-4]|nr:MAG: alanine dehydrogenase [Verrucomicrobia bacterium 21-51-4]
MNIGVPREIKAQEHRVAVTPSAVHTLTKQGHRVFVERGAGLGAGFKDEEYTQAGATIQQDHASVFNSADLLVKVIEPLPEEYALLRPDMILFTYLHLAADKTLTESVQKSGVTGIAYETILVKNKLPLLEPMSEIAGRMSVIVGANLLTKHAGGSGVLLPGIPGVSPGKVLVLGGGTSGTHAARMAAGLGADVTILEINGERIRHLEEHHANIRTLFSNEDTLNNLLPTADLVVGAVLIPGAKAPRLLDRNSLKRMRPGSVFVDIAIDQGGCAETSHATTHQDPTYLEEGVIHYCVGNMPGAYARTSTIGLTNATFPYVQLLANKGLKEACKLQPSLIGGINTLKKHVTCLGVSQAHDIEFIAPESLL